MNAFSKQTVSINPDSENTSSQQISVGRTDTKKVQKINTQVGAIEMMLPNFDGIPAVLRKQPTALWIAEPELDADGNQKLKSNGKPRIKKAPRNAAGYNISKNKPKQWLAFEDAKVAFGTGKFTGVGILMRASAGLVGIDLDDINDLFANDPALETLLEHIREAGIYCERSPSGTGLRMFVHGQLPNHAGKRKGGIELYSDVAFLTVTGQPEWPGEIKVAQWLVDELLDIIGATDSTDTFQAVTTSAAHGQADPDLAEKLEEWARYNHPQLWGGWWNHRKNIVLDKEYPSQSEADMALVGYLTREAFASGCSDEGIVSATVWETFRKSGLYRADRERQIVKYAIPKAIKNALEARQMIQPAEITTAIQLADTHGEVLTGRMFARVWKDKFIYVGSVKKWLIWKDS
jgi:primase-polymerase (primpol)-like protein